MINSMVFDDDVWDTDPAALERAVRSASLELPQVIGTVARRHLHSGRRESLHETRLPTWRTLQTIDEHAFENPGFVARHDEAVRAMFVRFGNSRLAGADLDSVLDWRHDDDDLPVVYLLVRALAEGSATPPID